MLRWPRLFWRLGERRSALEEATDHRSEPRVEGIATRNCCSSWVERRRVIPAIIDVVEGAEHKIHQRAQEFCPCPTSAAVPTILVVPIEIDECWAVDLHWAGDRRTPLGDLVNHAKTYGAKPGESDAADRLGACVAWWARQLADAVPASKIETADLVCSVPANPPKQPYNLPDRLAQAVGARLGVRFGPGLLLKTRTTDQIKFGTDKAQKLKALAGVFAVNGDVRNKVVVVVDDVVLSGATLETLAAALRASGARRVIALAATRATKGLATGR
jgi:predicted amidophosphoribosyltransferase